MEIIIGVLGLVIAWLTFKYTFFSKPTEELNHLKLQFRSNQKLSQEVQKALESYIIDANAADDYIFPNITFLNYLTEMKESYDNNLSDKLYDELTKLNLPKSTILSMTKSLETQFSALLETQTALRLLNQNKT
ncbi:hypothetical protein FVB32_03790 [Flagellimonas hymeniacidonis]|uniref:Uncharacterized protein n=1 Tax=Flagellimonas hymeniacidonis TaxID=2603628 RepID=A0A5C8V7T7_9FLAO|nr:hypothetical protein [Flagellimonas hymeniacidonis]TXN37416.1 hypothetical protein FVB32_03790 [Flagellimonas hymeniacidonis]